MADGLSPARFDPGANPGPFGHRKPVPALSAPHDVYVILTSRCNLRCLHCYGSFGEDDPDRAELSGAEWHEVFRQLAGLGVFFVNLAGGEPTLHPDFPEIIDGLRDLDLHFIMTTNGMASRACLDAIARARDLVLGLKVSLDGPTPETHGALRRTPSGHPALGGFHQTLRTIDALKENDVPFTVASCLHQGMIRDMPRFVDLILEIRPTSWFVAGLAPTGRGKDNYEAIYVPDSVWPAEFWTETKMRCEEAGIYVRYIDMPVAGGFANRASSFTCPAATRFCEIHADGTMAPCPLARVAIPPELLAFESVRDRPVGEIWNGDAFRTFRAWRGGGCKGCNAFDGCGRCVAQSIQWFADPEKPPPYCIEKAELLGLSEPDALRAMLRTACRRMGRDQ